MRMIKTTDATSGRAILFNQEHIIVAEEAENGKTKVYVNEVGCFLVNKRFDCLVKQLEGEQDAAD